MAFGDKIAPHQKSMGAYISFLWEDAAWVTAFLDEKYGLSYAREEYMKFSRESIVKFENKAMEFIREFLSKTNSARPGYFNKITKEIDDETRILFLVLVILGLKRSIEALEMRDGYRDYLAPGQSYRTTSAAIFMFVMGIKDTISYEWPSDVFVHFGYDDGADVEDFDDLPFQQQFEPAPEPQQAPVTPERETIILVGPTYFNNVFRDGPLLMDSSEVTWCFTALDLVAGTAFFRLFDAKPTDKEISDCLVESIKLPSNEETRVLVIQKSLERTFPNILSTLADHHGRVYYLKPSMARSSEAKWVDNYLHDLFCEFLLRGEPPPSIDEINGLIKGPVRLACLESPKGGESWRTRREMLAEHTVLILQSRGTILPEGLLLRKEGTNWNNSVPDLDKELRRLKRYDDSGRLNKLGNALYKVGIAVKHWQESPVSIQSQEDIIGETIVRFMVSTPLHDSRWTYTESEFSKFVCEGSKESDLLERAVFKRINKGVPIPWIAPTSRSFAVAPYPTRTGTSYVYWIPIELLSCGNEGVLTRLPHHVRLGRELTARMGIASADFFFRNEFFQDKAFITMSSREWVGDWDAWRSAARNALQFMQELDSSTEHTPRKCFKAEEAPGKARLQLVVELPDGVSLSKTDIISTLTQVILEYWNKAGHTRPALKLCGTVEDFHKPYMELNPRLHGLLRDIDLLPLPF